MQPHLQKQRSQQLDQTFGYSEIIIITRIIVHSLHDITFIRSNVCVIVELQFLLKSLTHRLPIVIVPRHDVFRCGGGSVNTTGVVVHDDPTDPISGPDGTGQLLQNDRANEIVLTVGLCGRTLPIGPQESGLVNFPIQMQ